MSIDPSPPESAREAAAHWFSRMRRPDAALFKPDFEAWLAASPDHRSAYNRVAETFSLGKNLTTEPDSSAIVVSHSRVTAKRSELVLVALSIMLGSGFALTLWHEKFGFSQVLPPRADSEVTTSVRLVTNVGQLKSFRLTDGSFLTLDADSRVSAALNTHARTLRLERGRARFSVAHDGRPFIVAAGAGAVIARGTLFDVALRERGELTVKLLQGSVEVLTRRASRDDAPVSKRQMLTAGQQLTVSARTSASPIGRLIDDGWMRSPIDFDHARLADVVAQANYNAVRPIRIDGAGVGDLKISGTFRISDTSELAERLASLFDLVNDTNSPSEIVLRRPQAL